MIYLLDTHYLLWSLYAPEKINAYVRNVLENEHDTKLLSGVNLWEISLKYSLGKLDLGDTNPRELFDTLLKVGYEVAALEPHLLVTYYQLPKKDDHKDPFDRLLIWQAISNGYTLDLIENKLITSGGQIVNSRVNSLFPIRSIDHPRQENCTISG